MEDRPMKYREGYTLEEIGPIIRGEMALPNAEEATTERALWEMLRYSESMHGLVLDGTTKRAAIYFWRRRGDNYDIEAFVFYDGGYLRKPDGTAKPVQRAAFFSMCKHQMLGTSTRAESQRGWHQGYCKLCGKDMSYDSGD